MSYFSEIYGDPELSARAKQVLVYLHDRANKDGESWYAINTMAKDLSLSRSTIKRALAELIRQGRVEKQVRFRENGGCSSNYYQLTKYWNVGILKPGYRCSLCPLSKIKLAVGSIKQSLSNYVRTSYFQSYIV